MIPFCRDCKHQGVGGWDGPAICLRPIGTRISPVHGELPDLADLLPAAA